MSDVNINNDPFEGPQLEAISRHEAAKTEHIKTVLQTYANPPLQGELTAELIKAHGLALVYQPTREVMWVAQHGNKIGPEFSTVLNFAL